MRYPCEKTQRTEKICKTFRKISRKGVDKATKKCYNDQVPRDRTNLGVAQLVARYLGVVEAASSSLVTQTNISYEMNKKSSQIVRFRLDFCLLCYCLFASTIPKMVWCIVSA